MRSNHDMLRGPLLPGILSYTFPIILTGVLQLLFNAADLVVVGHYCGDVSVGAVGATGSLTSLMVNLFIGFSVGAGVSVAHAMGTRENLEVHRIVHTALPTAAIGGVILTVVGLIFTEPLLVLMNTPKNVLPLSKVYMLIYFCGMPFNMVYNFSASILRAAGDTRSPLYFLFIAGVLNVVLNILFVTAFHMNVAGVALATVLSQAVSAVLVVITLARRTDACRLQLSKLRLHKKQLAKIARIGLPAGLQSSLFSISNVIIQSSINSFGDLAVSGNAAASSLEGFLWVCADGFHQTAQNYTGQNTGAMQYKRVRQTLSWCLACAATVCLVMGFLGWRFGETLLGIYLPDSRDAIAYGIVRLSYTFLPYFLFGVMNVTTGVLRGMGSSFVPMVISVLGICGLRLLWIFTIFQIPRYHTLQSLYISYPVSWGVTFAAQLIAFIVVYRRQTRSARKLSAQTQPG